MHLSYAYSKDGVKGDVDRAVLSYIEARYLFAQFSDANGRWISLCALATKDVKEYLEWARSQPGIASARVDILTETMMFPEKLIELLAPAKEGVMKRKA